MAKKTPKETTVTIDLSKELVETIQNMGYDPQSYFNQILNDLHNRFEADLKKSVVTEYESGITEEIVKSKGKTNVSTKTK